MKSKQLESNFFSTRDIMRKTVSIALALTIYSQCSTFYKYQAIYETVTPQNNIRIRLQLKQQIVGFWHIGNNYQQSNVTRDSFVRTQAKEILDTYLFSEGLESGEYDVRLNYVSTVPLNKDTITMLNGHSVMHEHPPKLLEMHDDKEYFEYPTLVELHSFCKNPANRDTIVFYIHTKTDNYKRQSYQNFLLGEECLKCLGEKKKTACGVNYRANHAWTHFSGNFWMAKCQYIAVLNKPWFPELLETKSASNLIAPWEYNPPHGRYFAEYWMMNDVGPRQKSDDNMKFSHALLKKNDICSNTKVSRLKQMKPVYIQKQSEQ